MNLTIIDVSGWIYRHFKALPAMTRSDGVQVGAVHGCTNALWRLMQTNPHYICAVYDAAKHTWRNDFYPEYKANRKPTEPELKEQFPLIRQGIEAFGVHSHAVEGYEADDVIATLSRLALAEGLDVTIVSSDKDLKQLITEGDDVPGVRMYDPLAHKMIGPNEVEARHGVRPAKIADFLALWGDSIDNIPGVPGVGEKGAAKLLNMFGDLDGVLAAAKALDDRLKPKEKTNLNLFEKDARDSRVLSGLKYDCAIDFDLEAMKVRKPDAQRVSDFLDAMEFVTLREVIFGEQAAA